jgi:leader peptidase (prepilin peptidase)/N-methyltransferase
MEPNVLALLAPAVGLLVHCSAWLEPSGAPRPGWRTLAALLAASLGVVAMACWLAPAGLATLSCGLGWALLLLAAIDLRRMSLPDLLTLPLLAAGLVAAPPPTGMNSGPPLFDHLIGALAGYGSFAAVAWAYRLLRSRDGLDGGDAKLLAAAGAWVGWQGLGSVVLIAVLGGSAWFAGSALCRGRRDAVRPVPFGPFLCAGLWLTWLAGARHVL